MATVSNLSPLAFEVLKFLCNSNDDGYQSISKETFGIESQKDFTDAIAELNGENLIITTGDEINATDSGMDAYSNNVIAESDNVSGNGLIHAKIKDNNGDVCKEMDYFLGAEKVNK